MAKSEGGKIEIRYALEFFPYPAVLMPRVAFAGLVSLSTLVAAWVMLVLFFVTAVKRARLDQVTMGRFIGIFGAGEMLLVDVIRHLIDPPMIQMSRVLWTLWPLAIGVLILIITGKKHRSLQKETIGVQETDQVSRNTHLSSE
jgi:cadmium resistance protein CadD (predicted permease)